MARPSGGLEAAAAFQSRGRTWGALTGAGPRLPCFRLSAYGWSRRNGPKVMGAAQSVDRRYPE